MAVRNRYLMLLKNEAWETWRRDWWRILIYDIQILGSILLFERSSLGAYLDCLVNMNDQLAWRKEIASRRSTNGGHSHSWFTNNAAK